MTTTESFSTAEKQLITTLHWFRTRYALFLGLSPDRKADRQSIEAFGHIWAGNFQQDWTEAFDGLCAKNILQLQEGQYSFTAHGQQVASEVDRENPFFQYEYDNFFQLDSGSKAHSLFCERVYGKDLSQHGLIDQAELSVLIGLIEQVRPASLVDLGCGNGRLTEYISDRTQTACLGLDISSEAIRLARQRTAGNSLLRFEVGNLNRLQLPERFDGALFLDTLYYVTNLQETLGQTLELLKEGGRIYAYFSQWIMDEAYAENLRAENTHLAKVLKEMNLMFSYTDLSASGLRHWKRKQQVLEEMREEFVAEGSEALWDYRYREAHRYANWSDQKYARYLYEIRR
jgi:SAM-dependent methyltransferase